MCQVIEQLESLFVRALEVPKADRASFVAAACGGDAGMAARVLAMVKAEGAAGGFLPEQPVGDLTLETAEVRPGDWIHQYRLVEQVGEGGSGVVFLAEQEHPVRRRVALKLIKLGMDTRRVVARFENERHAPALMDHSHIARVLDAGSTERGRPFFVMEWVPGTPLTDYCDRQRVSITERVRLFIQVCQAVQHAHQKGIIHRDLKPSNILVTLQEGVPVPKVIDFGIAKAVEGRLLNQTVFTGTDQLLGTPAYMSPEQVQRTGSDIDTRSDIYSLGVLLYELLVGSPPFDRQVLLGHGLEEMMRTIRSVEPPRPSARLSRRRPVDLEPIAARRADTGPHLIRCLRGDLDCIVMKCLEKDRNRRYATANGLASDLSRSLRHEPIVARPATVRYRLWKSARRNRTSFAMALGVVILLLATTIISPRQAVRAREARRVAEAEATRAEASEQESRHLLYAANMSLAQHKWHEGEFRELRRLLNETRTHTDRSFEWFYLDRLAHLEEATLHGHTRLVTKLALSPDERVLATIDVGGWLVIWDLARLQQLRRYQAHSEPAWGLAWAPDGRRMATADIEGTIRTWDVEGGQKLTEHQDRQSRVFALSYSPDGNLIAAGHADGLLQLWDMSRDGPARTMRGHEDVVSSVAWFPRGDLLATSSWDGTLRLWNATTGTESLMIRVGEVGVHVVRISPDGQLMATGDRHGSVAIWNVSTGRQLRAFAADRDWVGDVAFSADGRRIVSAGEDRTPKVCDAFDGRELFRLKGHTETVYAVAFCNRDQWVVSGSGDHTARVWDLAREEVCMVLRGHEGLVCAVAVSPEGHRIGTASQDGTVRLWEIESGKQVQSLGPIGQGFSALAFMPDGQRLITANHDRNIKIWDLTSGQSLLDVPVHTPTPAFAVGTPDGKRILVDGTTRSASLLDARTGQEVLTLSSGTNPLLSAAVSPDGQRIALGTLDEGHYAGEVIIWRASAALPPESGRAGR